MLTSPWGLSPDLIISAKGVTIINGSTLEDLENQAFSFLKGVEII